jgi:hypothetical protein
MNYWRFSQSGSGTLNNRPTRQVVTSAAPERNPDDDARCEFHFNAMLLSVHSAERGFFPIFVDILYELLIN